MALVIEQRSKESKVRVHCNGDILVYFFNFLVRLPNVLIVPCCGGSDAPDEGFVNEVPSLVLVDQEDKF